MHRWGGGFSKHGEEGRLLNTERKAGEELLNTERKPGGGGY